MTKDDAEVLARDWIDAWNSHDVERILAHYTDDFQMSSPYVTPTFGDDGTVNGKAAARAYWTFGLQRVPDMTFRLIDVFVGVDSVAIHYHTTLTNATAVEVLALGSDRRITRGHAHYTTRTPSPAVSGDRVAGAAE